MTFNNSSPHRQSVRLPDFDYSQPGAYFVTIVTQDRKMLFGQIVGGEMELNDIGRMVRAAWIAIPEHYPMVELGEFVIMPNHFHGIIAICVGESQGINVGARHAVPAFWDALPALKILFDYPFLELNSSSISQFMGFATM